MAFTTTSTFTALAGTLTVDLDADDTVEANVTGNSSGNIYMIDIDNTANTGSSAYLRVKDAASAATTDDHTWMFYAPAGKKVSYVMNEGEAYTSGICLWYTTNPAYQNASAPTSAVVVKLLAS